MATTFVSVRLLRQNADTNGLVVPRSGFWVWLQVSCGTVVFAIRVLMTHLDGRSYCGMSLGCRILENRQLCTVEALRFSRIFTTAAEQGCSDDRGTDLAHISYTCFFGDEPTFAPFE